MRRGSPLQLAQVRGSPIVDACDEATSGIQFEHGGEDGGGGRGGRGRSRRIVILVGVAQ